MSTSSLIEGTPGQVYEVSDQLAGSSAANLHVLGATILTLTDVYDFNPIGGKVSIMGNLLDYSSMNPLTNQLTMVAPLPILVEDNMTALVYPYSTTKLAMVQTQDDSDVIRARIPHSLKDRFFTGVRQPDERENVTLRVEGSAWVVNDVIGLSPIVTGSIIRTAEEGARLQFRPGPSSIGQGNGIFEMWSGLAKEEAPAEIYSIVDGPGESQNSSLFLSSPKNVGYGGRAVIQLYGEDADTTDTAYLAANYVVLDSGTEAEVYGNTSGRIASGKALERALVSAQGGVNPSILAVTKGVTRWYTNSVNTVFEQPALFKVGSKYYPAYADTGWLPLMSPVNTSFYTTVQPGQYRVVNGIMYLRGRFKNLTTSGYIAIGAVYSDDAVAAFCSWPAPSSGINIQNVAMNSDGIVSISSTANNAAPELSIAVVTYPI